MITKEREKELMEQTITLAEKSESEMNKISPKVGGLLTTKDGKIVLEGYRGKTGLGNHCEYGLLMEAKEKKIELADKILFVTLEPCTSRGENKIPCAKRILDSGITEVYIGTLDPNPIISGRGEMYLRANHIIVKRYPHDLIDKLNTLNKEFFDKYKGSFLPNSSLFMKKNISQLMVDYLSKREYKLKGKLPQGLGIVFDYVLADCHYMEEDPIALEDLLNDALGYAYDKKYASHSYENDLRGKHKNWISTFKYILKELNIESLENLRTLVVGIGNGNEGKVLYTDVKDLIIVDIAPESLKKAEQLLKNSKGLLLNAQNLSEIESCSIEAYISLMTYQSTYFDIDKALIEAHRVLKCNGIIILSIARGYLEEGVFIEGILNPQSNYVDRNRPYDLVEIIRKKLISFGYTSLGINTTPSEIFIYAKKFSTH